MCFWLAGRLDELSEDIFNCRWEIKAQIESSIVGSFFGTQDFLVSGGLNDFQAGKTINLSNTSILARSSDITGGTISLSAPFISIRGSSG